MQHTAFSSDRAPDQLAAGRSAFWRSARRSICAIWRSNTPPWRWPARPASQTWLCATFRLVIILFNHSVFGWVALAAALLNLMRPSIVLVAIALAAAGFGLVLHNADLSGLAVALLVLSLARPAPAPE